mmetsp:Transcript_27507/g.71371  ORF Transcript_27507/g.71371 Transcript_27507/m.71371 type:complete len:80 (+) Transcript_27507:30-269(+)
MAFVLPMCAAVVTPRFERSTRKPYQATPQQHSRKISDKATFKQPVSGDRFGKLYERDQNVNPHHWRSAIALLASVKQQL